MSKHLSWCKTRLFDVMGMSDATVAEYFLEMAKTSKSSKNLLQRVAQSGMVDIDEKFKPFADELFARVGKAPKVKGPSQLEIDTAIMKSKKYDLVDEDDESDDEPTRAKKSKKSKKASKSKHEITSAPQSYTKRDYQHRRPRRWCHTRSTWNRRRGRSREYLQTRSEAR